MAIKVAVRAFFYAPGNVDVERARYGLQVRSDLSSQTASPR